MHRAEKNNLWKLFGGEQSGRIHYDEFGELQPESAPIKCRGATWLSREPADASYDSIDHQRCCTVRGVRGDMNETRLGWVAEAFSLLDTDGSGAVDLDEIGSCEPNTP